MKYKKIVAQHKGGPEVLSIEDFELLNPKENEIRIRTKAIGASLGDAMLRKGYGPIKFPYVPGAEIVGEIDKIGKAVEGFKEGQLVISWVGISGGYSEMVNIEESKVSAIPDGLDLSETVSLTVNYVMALQLLEKAKLKRGDKILIHGAGGIGIAIAQLGSRMGLTMYGTASKQKHETIKKIGVIPIDYNKENFQTFIKKEIDKGVDVVFDAIGGNDYFKRSYKTLKRKGIYVNYGMSAIMLGKKKRVMPRIFLFISRIILTNLVLDKKRTKFFMVNKKRFQKDIISLLGMLKEGEIRPVIGKKLPLTSAAEAHKLLESSKVIGKLVLLP